MLHFRNHPLPELAEKFITARSTGIQPRSVDQYRSGLHHLYRFMTQMKIPDMTALTVVHITEFDEDLARHNLKFVTRRAHLQHVTHYVRWLEDEGYLESDTWKKLFPNYRPGRILPRQATLPELSERFIAVLHGANSPSTVGGYLACLRGFYKVQWKTGRTSYNIIRSDIEAYSLYLLHDRKMVRGHRAARLFQLRRYLDWLWEHKKLKTHPDKLVLKTDFPKIDEMLPKPFPVDVDIEIQRRLENSLDIDHMGLLLMRRCGLRCGEMRNLTIDCVTEDMNNHWFLKVPLGKLHNERIIPLDPQTVELIEKIKRHHHKRSEGTSGRVYLISGPSGHRRKRDHFAPILRDVARGLSIPGKIVPHRLRHSYATTLLSAGISITTLKALLGHRDIRMTLGYAAVTQETIRIELFGALTKIHSRYEVTAFHMKTPDLRRGVIQGFYDVMRGVKKFTTEYGNPDPKAVTRLIYRLNSLRHEFSVLLKLDPSQSAMLPPAESEPAAAAELQEI